MCRGNRRAQNSVLLIFSLIFYAWGEPKYVLLLMAMAFVAWLCAGQVAKTDGIVKKIWLATAAVIVLALIGYFKYAGLICGIFGPVPEFVQKIALPIGISFYTFQLLTYVVDVYRGEAQPQRSYWNVLLYAALFHQCIAGPIVRYQTIEQELFGPRQPEIAPGVSRFCAGLAKKVLLANPCSSLADTMLLADSTAADAALLTQNLEALSSLSVLGAWLGILAYALHIYLDFSAYSDMAIGMGQMLGLHYPENFNYPYISRTVTEFWRRWHISLSTFFRDYVYIPLGGSRCSVPRMVRNTFIVWALTGLWHGASWNFVLWGLWFFVFLMLERAGLKKLLEKIPILSNLYLLVVVAVGWVIFRFTDIRLGLTLVRSMFGLNGNPLTEFTAEIQLQSNLFLLLAAAVASVPLMKHLKEKLEVLVSCQRSLETVWNVVVYSVIPVVLLLLSTACLVGNSYNPFIYFRF
ncbi:MAG: MBOAT family O-acyltransferase [Candidatus Faecousia sp.]|nr:MBOAT family protein [Clostridiales bacterium]MDD5884339.1 MBOAT family protein [Bacillota bacterium]MDY4599345.1 MBOAT family O-acyltransferase [Candidatus Faecousia sp.]